MAVETYPILSSILVNTWIEVVNPKYVALNSIVWTGTNFVAVGEADGSDAYLITSPDGVVWTERTNPLNMALIGACVGYVGSPEQARVVAVGARDSGSPGPFTYVATSDDHGVTWTNRSIQNSLQQLFAVAWSDELQLFAAVGPGSLGQDSYLVTSPDGITWTLRSNPSNVGLLDIAWSQDLGLFCAVGSQTFTSPSMGAYIITSPDGVNWTQQANPKNFTLGGVAWARDDGLFIACGLPDGTDAYLLTSPDGITWTERANPKNVQLTGALEWNGSINICAGVGDGTDTYIITSSDGINWVERANIRNTSVSDIAWNGKVFIIVGGQDGTAVDAYMLRSLPVS
jgi:hypothetical protein